MLMKAAVKLNKELMKFSVPNQMTGLVSEISDLSVTFQMSRDPGLKGFCRDPWSKGANLRHKVRERGEQERGVRGKGDGTSEDLLRE